MGAPRSKEFDDVYFSAEDGFAETHYVYIEGNNLPERWAGREYFTIVETGFGTGLNFLCTWKLFNDTSKGQKLEFISFEKFPLSVQDIRGALEQWREKFPEELDLLLANYSANELIYSSGTHRIKLTENVLLTLFIGDINETMPGLETEIDCWFLGGFKPATNPDMWTQILFDSMAQLSKPDATFATFTSAGFVKRSLQAAGFNVKKIKGFGKKWAMLVGIKI